jgi:hypothetical protein
MLISGLEAGEFWQLLFSSLEPDSFRAWIVAFSSTIVSSCYFNGSYSIDCSTLISSTGGLYIGVMLFKKGALLLRTVKKLNSISGSEALISLTVIPPPSSPVVVFPRPKSLPNCFLLPYLVMRQALISDSKLDRHMLS